MILDTNAVSALLEGDPHLGPKLAEANRHHLPVVVIGEYRYGLMRSRHRRRLGSLLDSLARESHVLDVDQRTAEIYADVRNRLRQRGRPIPENDIWIAALAIQHEQIVVSRDAHFDEVSGIERLAW